MYEMGNMNNAP